MRKRGRIQNPAVLISEAARRFAICATPRGGHAIASILSNI
jgi:hypothetical protein